MLSEAREEVKRLTDESELTRQAKESAEEIIAQAKRVAREIKSGAADFADEILGQLEASLNKSMSIIGKAREELHQSKATDLADDDPFTQYADDLQCQSVAEEKGYAGKGNDSSPDKAGCQLETWRPEKTGRRSTLPVEG